MTLERGGRRSSSDGLFSQVVREPTLSDKVAELLLQTILSRQLKPGDRLPSERDLGEQFGVSRTVIREAVRSLVAKGVIDVRSGSGLRIAAVDAARVSESMRLYLHGSGVLHGDTHLAYHKIHEVREMLEVRIAGVACQNATAQDLVGLREVYGRMEGVLGEVEAASVQDVEFHRTIASITHNELYVVMLDSIGDVLMEIRRATLGVPQRPARALDFHRRILERIEARDADGARQAMADHLKDSEGIWRSLAARRPDSHDD